MLVFIATLVLPADALWAFSLQSLFKLFVILVIVLAASWLVITASSAIHHGCVWLMRRVEVVASFSRE